MDAVRLVLSAMGSATALGLAVVSATVLGVDLLRGQRVGTGPSLGAPLYLLFFGTLAGVMVAGLLAWRLLAPIVSTYRRGGLSVVSALATVLVMLLCIPVHQAAGRGGLVGLALLALVASWALARRCRRAALGTTGEAPA